VNLGGPILGIVTLVVIGALHPAVIKAEYYLGAKAWPIFLVSGAGFVLWSLFCQNLLYSGSLAILGVSLLWCLIELRDQKKRVEKGWYPANPLRAKSDYYHFL
jgi:hypothetical protein